jgi:aryl-alcohol dehydrogenase-like predicted oxidoreductase
MVKGSSMRYSTLGASGLSVSRVCLGTMTWGIQNVQSDADEQIQHALDVGINFFDTAEMYPVPPNEPTQGDTERCIGDWLSRNPSMREKMIIATKIAGPGFPYIRNNSPITGETIGLAIEGSLSRMKTDYIDVYQLHWPNRTTPHFGKHLVNQIKPSRLDVEKEKASKRDILTGIKKALDSGKIRHWALSDDTPWGIHTYLELCKEMGIPQPVSIQNEFNLLHVKDWAYLIETCVYENIAYLPWSPLSGGMLSGKYLNGALPKGSRWTFEQRNGIFRNTPTSEQAVQAYCDIAKKYQITPSQLALAWCDQVDGVTSTIIGATTMPQLKENIAAFDITLSSECLEDINNVLRQFPAPF